MLKYQILKINIVEKNGYYKFTKTLVDNSLKSKTLVDKCGIAGFMNNCDLNKKVAILSTKAKLKTQ